MAIKIKKSHRGLLHKDLGIKQGEKIPASKLKVKKGDSAAVKKRKVFAQNAKKWHHAQDGHRINPEYMDVPYNQATISNIQGPKPVSLHYNEPKTHPNWGNLMLDTMLGVDALIPLQRSRKPVVPPLNTYNQYPYGTGSQAIYEDGGCMNCGGYMEGGGYAKGGKVSKTGYRRNSKDRHEPYLNIPSNQISMQGVDHPVMGVDNMGNSQMMMPGGEYAFAGTNVTEFPMREPNYYVGQYGDYPKAENGFPFGSFIMPTPQASVPRFQQGGSIYKTQAEVDAANMEAKSFAARHALGKGIDPENTYVARKVGDPVLPYVNELGQPYKPTPSAQVKLANSIPEGIGMGDVYKTREGFYGFDDPHTGNFTPINPNLLNAPVLRKRKEEVANDLAMRYAKMDGGGWIIPMGVETHENYRKELMEYAHGGTIGENLQRDIYPSGRIKAQHDVYNPIFQAGGSMGGFSGIVPGLTGTMYSRGAYKSNEHITESQMAADGSFIPYGNYMMHDGGDMDMDDLEEAKGGWIAKAASSIKRRGTKGKCTPITKPGCTGRAKALAKTFKKIARNRKKGEDGLAMEKYYTEGETYDLSPEEVQHLIRNDYDIQLI